MSGSGNGGGGVFESDTIDCASLVIETQLSSPKADVIAGLGEGEVLEVAAVTMNATLVVVVLRDGDIAGGLASPAIRRLRECIEKGTVYKATVLSVNAGQVQVRVEVEG